MHSQISGTWIFVNRTTMPASHEFAALVDKIGAPNPSPFSHTKAREPLHSAEELYGIFSSDPGKQYDMREIIAKNRGCRRIREYRAESGENAALRLFAHRGPGRGHRREPEKTRADSRARSDQKRMEFGGVIYTESAEKARDLFSTAIRIASADFSARCERLHGWQGRRMERHHSCRSENGECRGQQRRPKITVICGGSFRRRKLRHVRQGLRSALHVCWPTARFAVMSGDAAASTSSKSN